MNKAMLCMCGLVIGGLVVTLVVVLETAPAPHGKIARAAAMSTQVK